MAQKQRRAEPPAFYTAKTTFYHRGTTLVLAGHTVAAGHPLLRGRKELFEPFKPTWPLEDEDEESSEADTSGSSEAEADLSARTDAESASTETEGPAETSGEAASGSEPTP